MVLRLKIFLSLFSLGTCLSTRVRNVTDVGVDVFAEWGVVPEDVVALSVSPFSSCRRFVV